MKLIKPFLALSLLLSACASPSTSPMPGERSTEKLDQIQLARKLVDIVHPVVDGGAIGMMEAVLSSVQKRAPLTASERNELIAQHYAKSFSVQELEELIAFSDGKLGRKFAKVRAETASIQFQMRPAR